MSLWKKLVILYGLLAMIVLFPPYYSTAGSPPESTGSWWYSYVGDFRLHWGPRRHSTQVFMWWSLFCGADGGVGGGVLVAGEEERDAR